MRSKRAIITTGLAWLIVCAVAAGNAAGEQRAFTCEPVSSGATFSDQHCVSASAGPSGFKHNLITGANTAITATNAKTASGTTAAAVALLEGNIPPGVFAVQCTGVSGSGELTNAAASVTGTITLEYAGCTVVKPAGRGCVIRGGKITTNLLKLTTVGQAANTLKIEPNTGTEMARVPVESCMNNKPPAGEYVLEGSYVASVSGATATTTILATRAAATLELGGLVAGLEGALTISMKEGNPITLT